MRLWLKIVVGLSVSLIVLIGISWFWLTGPERELAKNPIMKSISQQTTKLDRRVSLMPNPLTVGSSSTEVEQQLASAGFTQFEGVVSPTGWITKEDSDPYKKNLKHDDEVVFLRNHGNLVCDVDYIVFLKFDQSNSLVSAEGATRGVACL